MVATGNLGYGHAIENFNYRAIGVQGLPISLTWLRWFRYLVLIQMMVTQVTFWASDLWNNEPQSDKRDAGCGAITSEVLVKRGLSEPIKDGTVMMHLDPKVQHNDGIGCQANTTPNSLRLL